ncbi:MAG: hypothetical protein WCE21_02550 [Candidatus Babeliales bacterium]
MNEKFEQETQCELSYELLYLLKWLVTYEEAALKKLVQRAVAHGLKDHYNQDYQLNTHADAQAQYGIVELLDMLDAFLHEALTQENMRQARIQNLLPAINKIDSTAYDIDTMRESIDKATTQIVQHPEKNAREVLLKEILKNWKPHKQTNAH